MKALPAAIGVAVAASATLALRRYLAVREAFAAVPAELRSPLLPVLARDTTMRSLKATGLAARLNIPSGHGVTVAKRKVKGGWCSS
jgi:hypothetical protein